MPNKIVTVIPYQPQWAELFAREQVLLYEQLGKTVVAVHHIGSTAVVGLAAKPIIDIMLEVTCVEQLDGQVSSMTALGYRAKGENGIVGRRYFTKGGAQRSHHLHAFMSADEHVMRHLAFRDYLRNNPDIAFEYGQLKKDAAARCNNDSLLYCELKNEFVTHHERLAIEVFSR